ncbi:DUF2512 family protein (plasmid) [Bacillus megaterium]|nr:DUF2512 family protein [Priestia megaterium]
MKHLKALIIKFVMSAVVLGIILTGIYSYGFSDSMLIGLVLTVVAYALGDLLVYRNAADDSDYKNETLSLQFLILFYLFSNLDNGRISFGNTSTIIQGSIVSAIVITIGEWFFHKYLDKHVLNTDNYRDTDTTYNK